MALLDNLLGGGDQAQASSNSSDQSTSVGTDPAFGLNLQDVLHSTSHDSGIGDTGGDSSSFTGIGDLGIGFASPTFVGTSSSSDSSDQSIHDGNNGGLLGGLL